MTPIVVLVVGAVVFGAGFLLAARWRTAEARADALARNAEALARDLDRAAEERARLVRLLAERDRRLAEWEEVLSNASLPDPLLLDRLRRLLSPDAAAASPSGTDPGV